MNSSPPLVAIKRFDLFERPVALRLPFRFGSVTVREALQAFVRVEIDVAGHGTAVGMAADLKVPKWFDKSPALSNAENDAQLNQALRFACAAYAADASPATVFGHHARHAGTVRSAAQRAGLPGLVTSFGLALVDRALIDALARRLALPFAQVIQSNVVGFEPREIAPDLAGFDASAFLARLEASRSIGARHTVGLLDPLTARDCEADVPRDGLPVSLEDVIAAYGHVDFKLKLQGDIEKDLARLNAIASVLDRMVGAGRYRATLDGNEQYQSAAHVAELLRALRRETQLRALLQSLLYVEQPIARAAALKMQIAAAGKDAAGRDVPMIIDESDADDGSLLDALALGYRGVSSKACKGVWRSLANAMRLSRVPGGILSGEDLTTQAGLAVQQDLALVGLLGLGHVERNGHHYVDGFGVAPMQEAQAFLAVHPDLYAQDGAHVRLAIRRGMIDLTSVNSAAGFGASVHPDVASMKAIAL